MHVFVCVCKIRVDKRIDTEYSCECMCVWHPLVMERRLPAKRILYKRTQAAKLYSAKYKLNLIQHIYIDDGKTVGFSSFSPFDTNLYCLIAVAIASCVHVNIETNTLRMRYRVVCVYYIWPEITFQERRRQRQR